MATILIVDDSPIIQRTLSYTLQKANHAVVAYSNGKEALTRLAEGGIELAIIDLAMPEMDGLTLLKKIRAEPVYKSLPIIMLTASGQDEDRVSAREAGANAFLTKPASSHELTEMVQHLLAAAGPA